MVRVTVDCVPMLVNRSIFEAPVPAALWIRDAVAADAAAIAAVHVRSWLDAYRHGMTTVPDAGPSVEARMATWSQRLAQRSADEHLLVAVLDDHRADIAGFVWAGATTDADDDPGCVAQIRSVHVDPRTQRRGVGRALLAEIATRLSVRGYRQATLWVVADNASARAFYERLGWRPDGTSRRERLAMPGEDGPMVTVARYRSTVADDLGGNTRG